jgi:hypothetical protein
MNISNPELLFSSILNDRLYPFALPSNLHILGIFFKYRCVVLRYRALIFAMQDLMKLAYLTSYASH